VPHVLPFNGPFNRKSISARGELPILHLTKFLHCGQFLGHVHAWALPHRPGCATKLVNAGMLPAPLDIAVRVK